jgi:flagellum-specific peptidoglycan hydrolase FlgJ
LLAAGEGAQARVQAVLLAFPEISPQGMAKLAQAAALRKDNPNWAEQPRNPAGIPERGQWTSDEGGESEDTAVQSVASQTNDVRAKKERFVDAHLDNAKIAADQLGVPVENILGLSALESTWGEHRFANQGNNYFGIHYPAPFANGYMLTKDGRTKIATFANYAESLKSFVAISGSIVQAKRDPEAFATALQNSEKFGMHRNTGAKVPTYVGDVARTIRGIRFILARRRT